MYEVKLTKETEIKASVFICCNVGGVTCLKGAKTPIHELGGHVTP